MKQCRDCNRLYPMARNLCPTCKVPLVAMDDAGGPPLSGGSTHSVSLGSLKKMAAVAEAPIPEGATERISADMKNRLEAAIREDLPTVDSAAIDLPPPPEPKPAPAPNPDPPTLDSAIVDPLPPEPLPEPVSEPAPAPGPLQLDFLNRALGPDEPEPQTHTSSLIFIIVALLLVLGAVLYLLLAPT